MVEVVDLEPVNALVLAGRVARGELGPEIGRAIERVASLMNAARVAPHGPPFVRYRSYEDVVEMDVGFPVVEPQAVPSLRPTVLQGGSAATTWHEGSYDGLTDAFDAVARWIDDNGESAGSPWEVYWTSSDADLPRTQVVWPVTIG